MGRSRFCLAPRGITPWTIHLFVSMLAGCIPVPCPYGAWWWRLSTGANRKVRRYEDLEMDDCWVPELMTYSPYSWHGWYSHQACHYYGIRIMPYSGYTGMWCACAFACKKKKACCRGGINFIFPYFGHFHLQQRPMNDRFMSFMACWWHTDPCVATGHPLRWFGSTISRSPWLVQLRCCNESVDCEA